MLKPTLYPHQQQIISALRGSFKSGHKRTVLQAATGFGKTYCFSYMVSEHIKRGGKALILTDRTELLNQAGGAFEKFGLIPNYIRSGEYPNLNHNCFISMTETFHRRVDKYRDFIESLTMIVVDEAHRASHDKVLREVKHDCFVIGATATPYRKGKTQSGLNEFYQDMVSSVDTPGLIDLGYLARPRYFGVEVDLKGVKKLGGEYNSNHLQERYKKLKTFRGVVDNYVRLARGKKTIVFSAGIENSMELCNELTGQGFNARHLDSKNVSDSERIEILKWFNDEPDAILCNVSIATTGFNQPDIECVILYRATTSLPLYLQMVGRGGRVTETKKEFTILDFGNNISRFGFWDDPREWSLEKVQSGSEQPAPVKSCPSCDAILPATVMECQYCGHKFKPKEQEEAAEVELKEVKREVPEHLIGRKLSELGVSELADLQQSKAYKHTFIWRVVRSLGTDGIREYAETMGYGSGWMYRQMREVGNSSFTDYTLR